MRKVPPKVIYAGFADGRLMRKVNESHLIARCVWGRPNVVKYVRCDRKVNSKKARKRA